MAGTLFTPEVLTGVLATGIRLASPLLYAALGEMFAQRSGVFNLGVEGIMLMGAFTSFLVAFSTGNLWLGLLAAMMVGLLMGLLMAFVSVSLRAKQGISGIGIYILGWGLSALFFRLTLGSITTVSGFEPVSISVLSQLPFLGPVLFRQNILVYLALILVPVSAIILSRTTLGLQIKAVGENPEAVDSLGVNVYGIRYLCVTLGGIMAGLGGAFLTIGQMNMFVDNVTAGRGFIAIALVYFGRWNPFGILGGALLFSVLDALQMWVQVLGVALPYELLVMLPYVLTIVVLALAVGRAGGPAALGKPYVRGGA